MSTNTFNQQKLYCHWSGCQISLISFSSSYKTMLIDSKTEMEKEVKKTNELSLILTGSFFPLFFPLYVCVYTCSCSSNIWLKALQLFGVLCTHLTLCSSQPTGTPSVVEGLVTENNVQRDIQNNVWFGCSMFTMEIPFPACRYLQLPIHLLSCSRF